jgi:polyphosphate glucokinase
MNVLVIDIGGTNVKVYATGQDERREFASGPKLTPAFMVANVKKLVKDWKYDVVSIGYPGPARFNRPLAEPRNLGKGWVDFNFEAAFKHPVRIINDAALQALGSYRGGTMLFLGFGTGLGSAMVVEGVVVPFELGQLHYKKGTAEDYLGLRGLQSLGKKKWRQEVAYFIDRLVAALQVDDVVLGGGNVKRLKTLPKGCRGGDNVDAFLGGVRLWEDEYLPRASRKKALSAVPKKPRQKTPLTDKHTTKGVAA